MNYLFALDENTHEVIVSESPKGSNSIQLIERISQSRNALLYAAVVTLTHITHAEQFDARLFKAMDKICQEIYSKHTSAN